MPEGVPILYLDLSRPAEDLNQRADFVFCRFLDTQALEETEIFIKVNKHLPEIAPADIIEKEGIELGSMNIKLLQKIEELTLHLIEQNKSSKAQEVKLNHQDQQINSLIEQFGTIQKEIKK